jgi:hypothetical protein
MTKAPKQLGIEETYLTIMKIIYDKHIASIMLNGKIDSISFKIRNEKKVFIYFLLYSYSIYCLNS